MKLIIGWLYPDLMSTYGDRGNILALKYRAQKRGIEVEIKKISLEETAAVLKRVDLIFMGGAQDRQQEIVNRDLHKEKGKYLEKLIENKVPSLFVCGAYQFLGDYYLAADGMKIKGLGIFNFYTVNPGLKVKRLIGNIVAEPLISSLKNKQIIGFENHGGRTYLKDKTMAFAKVIKGFGNNGEDATEGFRYKNSIGTYLHGPILPKNYFLTDYLIKTALEIKYQREIKLTLLNNELEEKARKQILRKVLRPEISLELV